MALKAFRIYPAQELSEAKKILWKQAPIWKRLRHENVLPFYGIDTSVFQLALVYEWGQNGNITQFLESNPHASRSKLVTPLLCLVPVCRLICLKLLQVAKGLQYLHSFDVVHGDLKGVSALSPQTYATLMNFIEANVLISKSGSAQVCDYGLSPIISNPIFTVVATQGVAGSSRWLAPEIIDPPTGAGSKPLTASKSADVFAFAMLAVEVFTGRVPFWNMKSGRVLPKIVSGKRPDKPLAAEQLGLTLEMWKFIEKCWNQNPNKRPSIDQVVSAWEGFVNGYVVLSFGLPRNRHFAFSDNNRSSMSKTAGRRSKFTEPSTDRNGRDGGRLSQRNPRTNMPSRWIGYLQKRGKRCLRGLF